MSMIRMFSATVLALGILFTPLGHAARAQELTLRVVEDQTSATQVTIEWSQPASSAGFQEYQVMRGEFIPVSTLSGAGIATLLAGLLIAARARRRGNRRFAGSAAALGLTLALSLEVWAAISFQTVSTIPVFATTSYTDVDVSAGEGRYYKVVAIYSSTPTQATPIVFGSAFPPVSLEDSELVVRFENGSGPFTPADGAILGEGVANTSVSGCIAQTTGGCGSPGRGSVSGSLFANETEVQGSINGSFTASTPLQPGPNFIHMTGANSSGKSITIARNFSVAQAAQSGTLIPKALGIVISPKPASGDTLLDKIKNQINDQTPADWNEIFAELDLPRDIHVQNDLATLDVRLNRVRMDSQGGITVNNLALAQSSPSSAIINLDATVVRLNVEYGRLDGTFNLPSPFGTVHTCPVNGPPSRIRFGRIRLRVQATISLESGRIFLTVGKIGANPILADEAAGDPFDTDRLLGSQFCGIGARDLDAEILDAISDQAASLINHEDIASASIEDIPLGQSGLKLDAKLAELSQNPNAEGLVIRFDAGIKTSGTQVAFPKTNNAPPDSRTATGGTFPGAMTGALDAGFTLSDDLLNEGIAAAQAGGNLTGAISGSLLLGADTVPLRVGSLDPTPFTSSALIPNLHLHAPPESTVRIEVSYATNPIIGLRTDGTGGLRILQTGIVADVLVDVDRNGVHDANREKALTLDLDVLALTTVTLENGQVNFEVETPVRGYTATAGFQNVPHKSLEALANAIIDDRLTRLLTVLNGIGGSGLVIPGIDFTTISSVADGPTAAAYKDTLSAWGATSIDLKELILFFLNRVDTGR